MRTTINEDTTFLISDELGNVPEGAELGLYQDDTRFLSRYELSLNGELPLALATRPTDYYAATNVMTNPALAGVLPGVLSIVRQRFVGHGMHEDLDITNHGDAEAAFTAGFLLDADFAHIFEVKHAISVEKEDIRRAGSSTPRSPTSATASASATSAGNIVGDWWSGSPLHPNSSMEDQYDLIVVHDPQPLALCQVNRGRATRWVWRCHIDTCEPNPLIWRFLRPFLASYDAAIFTREEFVPHDVPVEQIAIIPPAIDPESPKNMRLGEDQVRQLARWLGIDLDRPFVVQVSRFDPWKDPLGVIRAYRLVKRELPELQLALVGSLAYDDPEGMEIYRSILPAAEHDSDLHVFTNLMGVSNVEVNALQRLADIAIQKSLREGFGLVVSETLWKGTPVVAGRARGIPLQISGRRGRLSGGLGRGVRSAHALAPATPGRGKSARGAGLRRGPRSLPPHAADRRRASALCLAAAIVAGSGRAGERRRQAHTSTRGLSPLTPRRRGSPRRGSRSASRGWRT